MWEAAAEGGDVLFLVWRRKERKKERTYIFSTTAYMVYHRMLIISMQDRRWVNKKATILAVPWL
jgi:hypothetical protein